MNKENSKTAAGLRRSAIAERIKLREEWLALKGVEDQKAKEAKVLTRRHKSVFKPKNMNENKEKIRYNFRNETPNKTSDALRGVVALVDVGSESRALPLRAALTALGASIVPAFNPLVTHLIWTHGGCRETRAKGRSLACQLVSPLWVEACANAARRLPERLFPAPTRPSDLPSPATLRHLLKRAEQENMTFANSLCESDEIRPRLRISSGTEHGTSADRSRDTSADQSHDTSAARSHDTSADRSHDTSADRSRDKSQHAEDDPRPGLMNPSQKTTAARLVPPAAIDAISPHKKSKRKLFTQRDVDLITDEDNDETVSPTRAKSMRHVPTQKERRELVRAERLARKLVSPRGVRDRRDGRDGNTRGTHAHRIVLTGMSHAERREVSDAIRKLNGKIQSQVNKKTTHVVLGSCRDPGRSPERTLADMLSDVDLRRDKQTEKQHNQDISGVNDLCVTRSDKMIVCSSVDNVVTNKPRTVNALLGAVRGCRVLGKAWVVDSVKQGRWLQHYGYEVPHLLKVSQKARVERSALHKMRRDYAVDVFAGRRVRVASVAPHRAHLVALLSLCGAALQVTECDVTEDADCDVVTVGLRRGHVSAAWVFDSVAAGRPRSTRRYLNKEVPAGAAHTTLTSA